MGADVIGLQHGAGEVVRDWEQEWATSAKRMISIMTMVTLSLGMGNQGHAWILTKVLVLVGVEVGIRSV
jgi:uncharacterized membrane protein YbaN (DUF454 family)